MNKAQAAFASMPQANQLALLDMATYVATSEQLSSYQTLVQAQPAKASDVQKLAVVSLMMSAANGKNGSDLTSAAVVGNYYTEYTAQANQLASAFNALGTNETADVKDGAVNANGTLWLSTTGSFKQEWNKLAVSAASGDTTAATEYYARYTAFMTKYASIKQLSDSLPALKKGVSDLKTGANTLNAGIKNTLLPGVKALYDGASLLNGNSNKLLDGTNQLDSGALSLKNGSLELSNGLVKFNEEGIQKLSNAFNGELKDFTNRIKAVDAASKEYKSFSGADDKMSSSVKFLIETKGINADK